MRWKDHRHGLRENEHDNPKLQRHYNKYGEEDLIFTIVEVCDKDKLIEREQYYFDTLNPWFNILKIAGRSAGHKMPDWLKEKLIKINTGRKDSPETTKRRSESHKGTYGVNNGRKFSEEFKKKQSENKMGSKNHFWGRHHTQKSIKKMLRTRKRNKKLKDKNNGIGTNPNKK